jgi:hypothetical protein
MEPGCIWYTRRAVTGMAVFPTRSSLIGYLASYGEFSWFSHVDLKVRVAGIPAPFQPPTATPCSSPTSACSRGWAPGVGQRTASASSPRSTVRAGGAGGTPSFPDRPGQHGFRLPCACAGDGAVHTVPRPAVSTWLSELSDDEVHARLVQRGVDESAARFLVAHREDPLTARMIVELLGGN